MIKLNFFDDKFKEVKLPDSTIVIVVEKKNKKVFFMNIKIKIDDNNKLFHNILINDIIVRQINFEISNNEITIGLVESP